MPAVKLREYQARIAKECQRANTIVVLPTGSGKTLIGAEAILRIGGRALFLVPTCLLVEQQANALRDWTQLEVAEFKGGMTLPCSFDVLVATPEAFRMAQNREKVDGGDSARTDTGLGSSGLLQWSAFQTVIFDEVI